VAYSEELAERIREIIDDRPGVAERKMFGGIAWMVLHHRRGRRHRGGYRAGALGRRRSGLRRVIAGKVTAS